jgi:hypothetical protein
MQGPWPDFGRQFRPGRLNEIKGAVEDLTRVTTGTFGAEGLTPMMPPDILPLVRIIGVTAPTSGYKFVYSYEVVMQGAVNPEYPAQTPPDLYQPTIRADGLPWNGVLLFESSNNGSVPVDGSVVVQIRPGIGQSFIFDYNPESIFALIGQPDPANEDRYAWTEQYPIGAEGLADDGDGGSITLQEFHDLPIPNVPSSSPTTGIVGVTIEIISGTGAGQKTQVTTYDSTTRIATVTPPWDLGPDHTSVYRVSGFTVALGGRSGIATLNFASERSGFPDQTGLYTLLSRGYCSGAPSIVVTYGQNYYQLMTISNAYSGTFTLTFDNGGGPQTTTELPYNVAAITLWSALLNLPNGFCIAGVSGLGTEEYPFVIQFNANYALLTADVSQLGSDQQYSFHGNFNYLVHFVRFYCDDTLYTRVREHIINLTVSEGSPVYGDKVLLNRNVAAGGHIDNGIWKFAHDPIYGDVWRRYAAQPWMVRAGLLVEVGPDGVNNVNTIWQLKTPNPITLDATPLKFVIVAPYDRWVQITSQVLTNGRYPGFWYDNDLNLQVTCNVAEVNGLVPAIGVFYQAIRGNISDSVNGLPTYRLVDPEKLKGVLSGTLGYRASATMRIWDYIGSSETDTGVDITVWDWMLMLGTSIPATTNITVFWRSGRWYVDAASCASADYTGIVSGVLISAGGLTGTYP